MSFIVMVMGGGGYEKSIGSAKKVLQLVDGLNNRAIY
jgi:hypothetical protein